MLNFVKKLVKDLTDEPVADGSQGKAPIEHYCFALMAITANADSSFDDSERAKIIHIGSEVYNLTQREAEIILSEAQTDADASTSLYEFTSVIHQHMTEADKFELIKSMWRVALADGQLDRYEEHIIRRVADLIYLEHARFIEAKHLAMQVAE